MSSPAKEIGDEEPVATEHSEPVQLEAEPEEMSAPETAAPSSADEQGPVEEGVPGAGEGEGEGEPPAACDGEA